MVTHFSIPAWGIPWKSHDRLQSMGTQELDLTTKPPPPFLQLLYILGSFQHSQGIQINRMKTTKNS